MIGEAIKKEGEKGSGGGSDAFKPGVWYVCSKAARVEMRNIASENWQDAADEMLLTSEMNSRVQKPYYHLALSWHEHEQPTDDQMFAAAEHMIESLGLEDHQIVIGTHHDTKRKHIHLVVNTVHPETGKVWSKSQDHQRIEKACREIELAQGWTHDRGRFDFDVTEDGKVELKPNPEEWEKKKADREQGIRPKSSGARKFEKSSGFETFEHGIPAPLKDRIGQIFGDCYDWQSFHEALGEIGLTYYKAGSGARVGILGSEEFAKASAFGAKFSITKMEKVLGAYEEPKKEYTNDLKEEHEDIGKVSGSVSEEDKKAVSASSFKMTLLRRVYCDIHLDPLISKEIKYVDLKDDPAQITFRDDSTVTDKGKEIATSKSSKETRSTIVAMAKAKGWSSIRPSGEPDFVRQLSLEAAREGLHVQGVPEDLQIQCDAIIESVEKANRRLEMAAKAAEREALGGIADRDQAIAQNDQERAEVASYELEVTAEARAVQDALGWGRDPVRSALRTVAKEEEARIKADLPDRRTSSNPQQAPDADRKGGAEVRSIKKRVFENDRNEIEDMKAVHIDTIAALGGWTYEPRHKDGHNDKYGQKQRTYTRGSDTIKCTFKDNIWVWKSNKSVTAGSVIDLWQGDNPGKNLGDARKAFREILGTSSHAPAAVSNARKDKAQHDHTNARQRWQAAPYVGDQKTYAEERGILRTTLKRFPDSVRAGVFGGNYFAHRNPETNDIQGFEQRWKDPETGKGNTNKFAGGGIKTICTFGDPVTAKRVVVFESGLDALALAEIENRDDTLYISTAGGFGPKTEAAIRKVAEGREILSGFDNDKAGNLMHEKIAAILPNLERYAPPSKVEGIKAECKDWLDVLNAQKKASAMPKPAAVGEKAVAVEAPIEKPIQIVPDDVPEGEPPTQPEDDSDTPEFT